MEESMGFENCTILIVDDNETSGDLLSSFFGRFGFKAILKATNGNAAISVVKTQPVDLILSDWEMPNMNGLELLKWIRSNKETMNLPFVMMTARTGEAERLEAIEAKVTDFIVKPFSPEALLNRLKNVLTLRGETSRVVEE